MNKKLIPMSGGKLRGKAREKKLAKWGKEESFELSPIFVSCPQSYPQGFPHVLQTVIRQSTDSTTITTLINIY